MQCHTHACQEFWKLSMGNSNHYPKKRSSPAWRREGKGAWFKWGRHFYSNSAAPSRTVRPTDRNLNYVSLLWACMVIAAIVGLELGVLQFEFGMLCSWLNTQGFERLAGSMRSLLNEIIAIALENVKWRTCESRMIPQSLRKGWAYEEGTLYT